MVVFVIETTTFMLNGNIFPFFPLFSIETTDFIEKKIKEYKDIQKTKSIKNLLKEGFPTK